MLLRLADKGWEWFEGLELVPKFFVVVIVLGVVLWILCSIDLESILIIAFWCGIVGFVFFIVPSGWIDDILPSSETTPIETINQPGAPSIPIPTQTPRPTFNPTNSGENYYRTFEWSYENTKWTYSTGISKDAYEYYRGRLHNRENDYSQYALSDYDRAYMQGIVNKFKEGGRQKGYSNYDNVMMIVSFVQSLPYTSDSVSTGYDEYPRYPLETLVDNGGDCEDTAILTAALIREMGYGAVLIDLPGHVAVGVKCSDNFHGSYYEYQGSRYYYLETTGEGFEIGEIPDQYKNARAKILPMVQAPRMSMTMNAEYTGYNNNRYYYKIHCDIENVGSGTAKNPVVDISALAPTAGSNKVWDQEKVELNDFKEGATGWAEATVSIPRDTISQIRCKVSGSNFDTVALYSGTFST